MSTYEAGDLSALISSGSSASQKRKKKAEKLKKLFSTPLPIQKGNVKDSVSENVKKPIKEIEFDATISPIEVKKKKKKAKRKTAEEQTQEDESHLQKDSFSEKSVDSKEKRTKAKKRKRQDSERNNDVIKIDDTRNSRTVFVGNHSTSFDREEDESHLQKDSVSEKSVDSKEKMTKAKKRKREDSESNNVIKIDDTRNSRTVFVGNLPTSFDKEDLKSLFKQFGKVESARIRSAAPPKESLPKKVAVIKKLYHPDVHSFNGFVVFEAEEMARAALELNGVEIQGHHIRVDIAGKSQEHDHKRSIFVGNLPFDIKDDDLWDFFKECGEIRQVRTIKDKETRIGKGFGYVLFETMDAAALALEKQGEKLKGRPLRISRSMKREKKIPKGKLSKEECKKLFANKNFQGKKAKERLRLKKNKKIAKNRLRLKKKKMIAQKLQSGLKKASTR